MRKISKDLNRLPYIQSISVVWLYLIISQFLCARNTNQNILEVKIHIHAHFLQTIIYILPFSDIVQQGVATPALRFSTHGAEAHTCALRLVGAQISAALAALISKNAETP